MPIINGTGDGETLNGTDEADTINAGGGNDTLNGNGGNDTLNGEDGDDTLNGGTGTDSLFGGNDNDTLVVVAEGTYFGETYDGGSGHDTLEVQAIFASLASATSIAGIESMRYAGAANSLISITYDQIVGSGLAEVVGNAFTNTLVISLPNTGTAFTVPDLAMVDWETSGTFGETGDFLVMSAPVTSANLELTAREGLGSTQFLIGSNGNDTFIGSSGRDMFNGDGGINVLNGYGGDDYLWIVNRIPPSGGGSATTFTGAGSTFDGGEGFDLLAVGGEVDFQGTLVDVEGIALQPASGSPGLPLYQVPAVFTLDLADFAMLPTGFTAAGMGTIAVDLDQGDSFDFSQVQFADQSAIHFEFAGATGGTASDVSWIGTTGQDFFRPGSDIVTIDGGGGFDLVLFEGPRSAYAWTYANGQTQISGAGVEGTLTNVSSLMFSDSSYELRPAGFAAPVLATTGFGASAASGSWMSDETTPRLVADLNGDGRADILGFAPSGTFAALGLDDGTFSAPMLASTGYGSSAGSGGWADQTSTPRQLADISGDGILDLIGFGAGGVYASLGAGDGAFGDPFLAANGFGSSVGSGGWTSQTAAPRLLADLNGDGRADIIGFGAGGTYVALADDEEATFNAPFLASAGFGSSAASGSWTGQDATPRQLGDVSGDGILDIVGFASSGTYVALGIGDGTFAAPMLGSSGFGSSAGSGAWTSQSTTPRMLADLNGDNLDDIIGFGAGGTYVALANGGGAFAAPILAHAGFGSSAASGSWTSQMTTPRMLADLNGDGFDDLIGFAPGGVYAAYGQGGGTFGTVFLAHTGFGSSAGSGGWTNMDQYPRILTDLNGDGGADILGFGESGVITSVSVSDWVLA